MDRVKHRENRHENKIRLDKIEGDIADIKSTLQALVLHLQSQFPLPALPGPSMIACPSHQEPEPLWLRHGAFHDSAHLGLGDQISESQAWASWPRSSGNNRLWTPIPCIESKLIDCRCGSQHLDRFDCLDQCHVTTFYQHQIAFPTMRSTPGMGILPRNPSLPSMMLHAADENTATFLLTGFLRQYKYKGIEQLLSFYLLGYRHMRVSEHGSEIDRQCFVLVPLTLPSQWQMNPCEETLRDVPAWMLQTEIQRSTPHSVVVDYLPWPRLRDHLCTSGDEDLERSLYFYFESTEFLWPSERPIFAQGEGGQMVLSPEFEQAVGSLEHWRIGSPWSDAFPHLLHLVEP